MPAGGESSSFRLPVTDDAADQQVRVVEGRPVRVKERVAELTTFVNRSGCFGRRVAGNSAGKRELLEQVSQTFGALWHAGIDLAVGPLEICIRHHSRSAMARTCDEDCIEIVALDHAIHVGVDEVQPGSSPPMAEQPWLDVREREPIPKQRIVQQVYLSDRQVVGGSPVRVDSRQLVRRKRCFRSRCHGRAQLGLPPSSS